MAIRLIFLLLVFANLVFFAWTQGTFGFSDDGREPQRLEQQLHAEKLRVLRVAQPTEVKKDEAACRVINGLSAADAEVLKAAVEADGGVAKISSMVQPVSFQVVVGDLANKAAAERKIVELTRLGIEGHDSVALEGGRYEIVLGSFPSDPAAREFLQSLAKRGIRTARVDKREQAVPKLQVEARAPASTLLQQLPKLIAPYAEATLAECVQ